jgi:hypothetical protein
MSAALSLVGYTDADWANNINDHCSIGGHIFILGGTAISWSTQKHQIIMQSTNKTIWL